MSKHKLNLQEQYAFKEWLVAVERFFEGKGIDEISEYFVIFYKQEFW